MVFEPPKRINLTSPKAVPTRTFTASKIPDLSGREALNKELGLAGELFVLNIEKQRLLNAGLHDLANRVEHISQTQGDGAGYDIRSFKEDGSVYFLEVKTTQGGKTSAFFISPNELEFGKYNVEKYAIRVFNFRLDIGMGKYFELIGDPYSHVNLAPTNYRASF